MSTKKIREALEQARGVIDTDVTLGALAEVEAIEKGGRATEELLGLVYFSQRMSAGSEYVTINMQSESFERVAEGYEALVKARGK